LLEDIDEKQTYKKDFGYIIYQKLKKKFIIILAPLVYLSKVKAKNIKSISKTANKAFLLCESATQNFITLLKEIKSITSICLQTHK